MKTPNPLDPASMSTAERLAELAGLLATGLIRLNGNKSNNLSPDRGESSVDFASPKSGHATRNSRSTTR